MMWIVRVTGDYPYFSGKDLDGWEFFVDYQRGAMRFATREMAEHVAWCIQTNANGRNEVRVVKLVPNKLRAAIKELECAAYDLGDIESTAADWPVAETELLAAKKKLASAQKKLRRIAKR